MAQHKVTKKNKTSLPPGAQKALKKKKGTKKQMAHKTNHVKTARNERKRCDDSRAFVVANAKRVLKADGQRMDAAISKLINKKNEESVRARAKTDMRAGKN